MSLGRTNSERVKTVSDVLYDYAQNLGPGALEDFKLDPAVTVGDFLCDIMHFCERRGIPFKDVLANGRMHYRAERRCTNCRSIEHGIDCCEEETIR